jgi:hypothetical protein
LTAAANSRMDDTRLPVTFDSGKGAASANKAAVRLVLE